MPKPGRHPIDNLAKFWEELDRLPLLADEGKYLADMQAHGMGGTPFLRIAREDERSSVWGAWNRLLALTHDSLESDDRASLRRCLDIAERALEAGAKNEVFEAAYVAFVEEIRFSGTPEEHLSFASLMGPRLQKLYSIIHPEIAARWSPARRKGWQPQTPKGGRKPKEK